MQDVSAPTETMNDSTLLRTAGILAILGGIANAVSDYLLQGGLIPRAAVNTYDFLPFAPYDLVFIGSIIGNAAIPLWLLGFWPVYVALAPAGRWLAIPTVCFLGYGFSLFPGYHGAYALYAAGFQAQREAPEALSETTATLVQRLHDYHDALLNVIGVPMMVGSLLFAVTVLLGRTLFSRWVILISPIVVPFTQPFIEMLPAPYGGLIRPAWGTTVFTVFFLVATVVTWNVRPGLSQQSATRPTIMK